MDEWRMLVTAAYGRFHDELETSRSAFPGLASFHASERAEATRGTMAWDMSVASEAQETINGVNSWGTRLHQWRAWNVVLEQAKNDKEKWEILDHFIEPLAFFCMHQPSATYDRLALIAENALHQANLRMDPGRPDHLMQDRNGQGGRKELRRDERRKQLDELGADWSLYHPFAQALSNLNGPDYRWKSRNFRNLASHAIAPRLELGDVLRAHRTIEPWSEPVRQTDGSFLMVEQPGKTCVSYGIGAVYAMPSSDAHSINLAEYQRAKQAIERFSDLVDELCDRVDSLRKPALQKSQ
jgi:hypothetical protein